MKIPNWFCDYLNEHHVDDMRMREFAWKVYQKGKRKVRNETCCRWTWDGVWVAECGWKENNIRVADRFCSGCGRKIKK